MLFQHHNWESPVPETSPNVVEVLETNCPFSEVQAIMPPTVTNLNYLEAVQTFIHIANLLPNNQL